MAHAPGDQLVRLSTERAVIAGDLLEEWMFRIVPFFPPMIAAADIDVARLEAALADMIALRPRLIVPMHGNVGGDEITTEALDYFSYVRAVVRSGVPNDADLETGIRARYPTWENSVFIKPGAILLPAGTAGMRGPFRLPR